MLGPVRPCGLRSHCGYSIHWVTVFGREGGGAGRGGAHTRRKLRFLRQDLVSPARHEDDVILGAFLIRVFAVLQ